MIVFIIGTYLFIRETSLELLDWEKEIYQFSNHSFLSDAGIWRDNEYVVYSLRGFSCPHHQRKFHFAVPQVLSSFSYNYRGVQQPLLHTPPFSLGFYNEYQMDRMRYDI